MNIRPNSTLKNGVYFVQRPVGAGGQAMVYQGHRAADSKAVAIKHVELPRGDLGRQVRERALREGRLQVKHPNICEVIDCFEEGGDVFIVSQWIEGPTLQRRIDDSGTMGFEEAAQTVLGIASGLDALHNAGMIHRDLKPANIMILLDGRPVMIDFGIGKDIDANTLTSTGGMMGTPGYMAPEQIMDASSVNHLTDLFALGCVLYYILTGRSPFAGGDLASIAVKVCRQHPPSMLSVVGHVSAGLEDLCLRLMAKRPEQRPQSASDVIDYIYAALPSLQQEDSKPRPQNQQDACHSCGYALEENARFCRRCGAENTSGQHLSPGPPSCLACGHQGVEGDRCERCGREFVAHSPVLLFTRGPAAGTSFRCPEGSFHLERSVVCPRDMRLSRKHAQVQCANGQAMLQDHSSSNGTWLAGRRVIQPIPLTDQLEFTVADNVVSVMIPQPA